MKYALTVFLLIIMAGCSQNGRLSDAYGNFESDEVIVSAEANGKILSLNITEGMALEKGQAAGHIDSVTLFLKQQQLLAQKEAVLSKLVNIEAQIKVQEQHKTNLLTDKRRIESLLKEGAATQKQLDDISGSIDLTDAQTESVKSQKVLVMSEKKVVESQMDEVRESISRCTIINPAGGTVLSKYAENGEITSYGKPLYKIAALDTMTLKVYVDGSMLSGIISGQEAEVVVDDEGGKIKRMKGWVSWVSSNAEFTPKVIQTREERVNLVYAVKIRVPNDGTLKIGMPGEVNF
ncbi:MAG: efflux RND transporter periplasmic adaptor subunit [Bacteroidales bacterium]|nr:efflux RND transporter periplasmic adaptor subunit [Bacteroidales bacterium]